MPSPASLPGEFELIDRYFAPLSVVGGIDFPISTAADLIARKVLRVNLSDLTAKGAVPRAYMLNLILPDSIEEKWIAAFAAGLRQDQAEFGLHLIGGDMSATPGPVTIAVMALGEVPIGKTIRRGAARAG